MGRIFLKIAKSGDGGGLEILFVGDEGPADSVVFHIVPDKLIRIEFGAVGRQKEQAQFVWDRFQECLKLPGPMRGMTIEDQEDFSASAMNETFEELQKNPCVHRSFGDHKSERALGGNGGDHVEPKPLACGSNHRGLSLEAPSGPGMKIRTNPRLVFKEDLSPFPLGPGADPRIFLLQPLFDQGGVLLQSLDQRSLTGESQLGQQPSNGRQGQFDAISFPEERPDHTSGPEGKREFQLQGIFGGHGPIDPADLASREFFGAPGHSASLERVPSAGAVGGEPLVDATTRKPKGLDNQLGAFAILDLLDSPDPNRFASLVVHSATVKPGWDRLCGHAFAYHNNGLMYSELCTD